MFNLFCCYQLRVNKDYHHYYKHVLSSDQQPVKILTRSRTNHFKTFTYLQFSINVCCRPMPWMIFSISLFTFLSKTNIFHPVTLNFYLRPWQIKMNDMPNIYYHLIFLQYILTVLYGKSVTVDFRAFWREYALVYYLSLIHIWRCRRSTLCRSRWSPYH